MERRSTRAAAGAAGKRTPKKEVEKPKTKKEKASTTKTKKEEDDRPESPFFGFSNSDIPQPIVIKTEPVSEAGDEECVVVSVSKAPAPTVVKTEKVEDDDMEVDTFHGFGSDDLPVPIVIKEEAREEVQQEAQQQVQEEATQQVQEETKEEIQKEDEVETQEEAQEKEVSGDVTAAPTTNGPVIPVEPKSNIPGDNLLDEFESAGVETVPVVEEPVPAVAETVVQVEDEKPIKTESPVKIKKVVSPAKSGITLASPATKVKSPKMIVAPPTSGTVSPQKNPNIMIVQNGKPVVVQQSKGSKGDSIPQIHLISEDELQGKNNASMQKIQIIDQNGEKIELITQDGTEGEFETDTEGDHEFTVIVENNDQGEVTGITRDIHIDENNVIAVNNADAMEIEDIIAQFEENSAGGTRTVSCPNCKKCFVSSQFLNMHIANTATMCDLCNTQCCSQVNLRNHKNLECDLSKRKRNIDLIAKETALLGRKPIEPEKYYNLPIESDEDMEDEDFTPVDVTSPQPAKKMKSINDAKYECSVCGKYVKILDSHMRFVHGMDAAARGDKFRCPECSVLVSDLETHIERRHGDNVDKIVVGDITTEVVRCRHPGCDLFFNNAEEVAEHIKREHTDEVR